MPLLLALKGHPGVGKSTLAKALVAELRSAGMPSVVVSKDACREALEEQADTKNAHHPTLNAAANAAAVAGAAATLADGTRTVVLDATLSSESLFVEVCRAAGAGAAGARVAVVEVVCERAGEEEWDRRLKGRPPSHKPASLADVRELIQGYAGGDGWVEGRIGESERPLLPPPPPGGWLTGPLPLALPWREAGVDRADYGLYVRVDTGAGVGVAELARAVVGAVREQER